MNKKLTLPFFLFLFCFANINAQNIFKICIQTELNEPLENVEFTITGNADATQIANDADGCYQFEIGNTAGTFSITPSKNINHLNGVDVADLFNISKHILGIEILSDFQVISSDLNTSSALGSNNSVAGGLTTFDMVLLSKSITRDSSDPILNIPSWIFYDPDSNMNGFVTIVNNIQEQAPLNSDVTVDLLAGKSADANLSANPVLFEPVPVYDLTEKLTFRTPDLTHNEDDVFDVIFTADNFNNIIGYQHTIKFDENKMEFLEIISGNSIPNNHVLDNLEFADEGIVNTIWVTSNLQSASTNMDEILFTMRFRAKEDLQISEVITFNSASTLDIAYNSGEESMEVILLFGEPTSNKNLLANQVKFENHPNPFQTSTQIEFTLTNDEFVKLEIIDALGKVVETLVNGQQTAGEHQILFTPKNLASGIYYSRLTVGESSLVQKLIHLP